MNAASRTGGPSSTGVTVPALRDEVGEALERLSRLLVRSPVRLDDTAPGAADGDLARVREAVRFLGQIASGWPDIPEGALPEQGAGFGSTVVVVDADAGGRETYTLMTGALLDIDAGQVSLASPIGRALLGTTPGAVVTVDTPQRRRRLRIVSVVTLRDRLRD